tara:strand:- start:226172 stop:227359 length:1188 start_codon:yes stop_codon:yes gene_type:complete
MTSWFSQGRIYLDAAAGEQTSTRALEAFQDASRAYGNPSSPHEEGRAARAYLEKARKTLARLAEVKPEGVIFTSHATEANNLLILGHLKVLKEKGRPYSSMHVLYLPSSHSSILSVIEEAARLGVVTEALSVPKGALDLKQLALQLRDNTVLVLVDGVCGETGIRFPVRDVRRALLHRYTSNTPLLHVDATQLPTACPFELTRLGADSLSLDSQKVGGVRGCGALILAHTIPLSPLLFGGGQEKGLRPGTENPALAHAFAVALEETHEEREAFVSRAERLRTFLKEEIQKIPNVAVHEGTEQAPHILSISLLGRDTDYLVTLLDTAGFSVATKSACESDREGSRAVFAYTGSTEQASSTLRVSWGKEVSMKDMRRFSRALQKAVEFLDSAGILKT